MKGWIPSTGMECPIPIRMMWKSRSSLKLRITTDRNFTHLIIDKRTGQLILLIKTNMEKITEQPSLYNDLEKKSVEELTSGLITEYKKIAPAVEAAKPQLDRLLTAIVEKVKAGGRMIYLGAGTGGRLSVLDVLELPTTFGMEDDTICAVLAGGIDKLIFALEEKEDDEEESWEMLTEKKANPKDIVVGISASGTTPFVLYGLQQCKAHGIITGCIVNNPGSPIAAASDYPVEVITGPEFVTGSTRMKAGTSQKMVFDMISTTVMIQLGRVLDNRMVNVKLINRKITDRAVRILMDKSGIKDYEQARAFFA
jgi:N-acetylmuramic acid 6-phosphate etherase